MTRKYIVVDLETTGNTHDRGDRIIQFSAVVIENLRIVDQYTTFINPGIPIPPFIEELTGIHDGMVHDAPEFKDVASIIHDLLKDAIFVAHNVIFDLRFLRNELDKAGYSNIGLDSIDTVEFAKILMPTASSFKLSELAEMLQLEHENPHQADSDALVTAELFLILIERVSSLPLITIEKLTDMAYSLKSDLYIIFQGVLQEKRKNIENLHHQLEVFRGIALKKKIFPQRINEERSLSFPKSIEEKMNLFSEMNDLKLRIGQIEMMDAVYQSFLNNKYAVIEAGTGTGKTLAYLLPSLYFANIQRQPVIISTYTIQMQEQIFNEIDRLKEIIPFSFQTSILKGRSNYINMLKFEQTLYDKDPQYDTVITKMQLLVWLVDTETGDMDELNVSSGGKLYIQRIKHDGWFSQKEKDPWIAHDFYLYARNLASRADLVITNHSMLLLDTENDQNILPDYQYIVIDEAHNLEKTARNCFGKKLEYNGLKFWIGRLGTLEKNNLFSKLEKLLNDKELSSSLHPLELEHIIIQLDLEIDELFNMIGKKVFQHYERKINKNTKQQLRITETMISDRKWIPIVLCAERVYDYFRTISKEVEQRLTLIKRENQNLKDREQAFLEETNSFLRDWNKIGEKIQQLFIKPSNQHVIWVEGDIRALPNSIGIYAQPINLGEELFDRFFIQKKGIVMTSATLTVNQSFNYFLNELGLPKEEVVEKIIPSPFCYKDMVKLMIPSDLPEVRGTDNDEYIEAISNHIISLANATDGKMLVLFTSYDMLRKTYQLIKDSSALEDFILLAQGITSGSRTRLTRNFQQFNKSILFGTSSFWEGVDIPGEDLSCLVIVRLPFSPPDEPITAAKYELIKKNGKNPFSLFALPEAVIRFKQGFGRLIRTESDRGVVIVLDRRIETTIYGKTFLNSIPDITVERGPLNAILSSIEKWL
ncbi:ATP-dependent DNA helicase DinG [Lederbergia wuyishanensis]|uniref:3'-5' exonuclease DinG n=1 Tax=Lederbergia wuyishanensis TaxID=1347903 RepID=A0ABU0D0V0_9BACI|nr:ATP-dependent DNA helicase DinG [Lederbergia wuyishanensis]MCJ8006651.1 ATP-dependent DNA helicase DinG [Lederbergia wuyishanensis]MDQ0342033.1 ATP-dependent DNA helicase DinG [Lederbergia wuyishanensis]